MSPHPPTRLLVNGLDVEVQVDAHLLEAVLVPFLTEVAARPRASRRAFVFMVGPPGVGKSTLAAVMADAAGRAPHPLAVQAVGIDGFHLPHDHLATHYVSTPSGAVPLSAFKGAPQTFDVEGLARHLDASAERDLAWPAYDRRVHDVVPDAAPVTADLVVVEGNWLLLDEPGWRDLVDHASGVVLLTADPALLRKRLIERKVRGGLDPAEAAAFFERSDRPNIDRVLGSSDFSTVDLALAVQNDGTIQTIQQGEMR